MPGGIVGAVPVVMTAVVVSTVLVVLLRVVRAVAHVPGGVVGAVPGLGGTRESE